MFLKVTKSKNYKYLQLVESYREGSATKHRLIASLGRLDKLEQDGSLTTIAKKFVELSGVVSDSLEQMEEINRLNYGHLVYQKLFERLGLDKIIEKLAGLSKRNTERTKDIIYYLIVHRLLKSGSKLQAFTDQGQFYNLNSVGKLHMIYRSLDFLADYKAAFFNRLRVGKKGVFSKKIDIALYDVTTFHFESNRADDFKDFGFSKANKVNEVQVVLGMFIDTQGRPIGYELFPGNTFDSKTMLRILEQLKEQFLINKIIIVADKGLNSKSNFHLIRQKGYDYIVATRLKSMSKQMASKVLDKRDLATHTIDQQTGEVTFQYKILDYKVEYKSEDKIKHQWDDKLLVTWSSKRNKKDKKDRHRQIEKAKEKLERGDKLIHKKGANRYLRMDKKVNTKAIAIDEDAIQTDEQWDGYYGIQFSRPTLDANQVLTAYKSLWKIEESFRVLKTTMKTRPIFHWTTKRIKGHFMLCFLAFMLERELELVLTHKKILLSPEQIKKELNLMQFSKVKIDNNFYHIKSANSPYTKKILKAVKIPEFNKTIPITESM